MSRNRKLADYPSRPTGDRSAQTKGDPTLKSLLPTPSPFFRSLLLWFLVAGACASAGTCFTTTRATITKKPNLITHIFDFGDQRYIIAEGGLFREMTFGYQNQLSDMVANFNRYVTNGREVLLYSGEEIWRSEDLNTFQTTKQFGLIYDIAWDGDQWRAMTRTGCYLSPNGKDWVWDQEAPKISYVESGRLVANQGNLLMRTIKGTFSKVKGRPWLQCSEETSALVAKASRWRVLGEDFVIVLWDGSVYRSRDGQTWQYLSQFPEVVNLIGNGNVLISLSSQGATISEDGIDWQPIDQLRNIDNIGYTTRASWTGRTFVLDVYRQGFFTSENGRDWSSSPTVVGTAYDAAYGNNRWVWLHYLENGYSDEPRNFVKVLGSDGHRAVVPLPEPEARYRLIWSGRRFAALPSYVGLLHLYLSEDGETWQVLDGLPPGHYQSLAENDDRLVLIHEDGSIVTVTTDGEPRRFQPAAPAGAVVWDGSRFVVHTTMGALISSDGLAWQPNEASDQPALHSLAYGNGVYVGIGEDGAMVRSENSTTWEQRPTNAALQGRDLHFNGRVFVFSDYMTNRVWSSADGRHWVYTLPDPIPGLRGVFDNGTELVTLGLEDLRVYECSLDDPAVEPRLRFVLPWVVHNQNWSTEIVFSNRDHQSRDIQLTAITSSGETVTRNLMLPAISTQRFLANELFADLSGYALQVWADFEELGTAVATLNREPISGGASPAAANGFHIDKLQQGVLFPYLPGDQIPAMVVAAPQAADETAMVEARLYGEDSTVIAVKTVLLDGARPHVWLLSELFPEASLQLHSAVEMVAEQGKTLIGTSFVFNERRQPSMTQAIPVAGVNKP